MPISVTGCDGKRGFTLIELVLVLFIIALISSFTLPRLFNIGDERLKSSARKLAAFSNFLITESALKQSPIKLYYDLDKNRYWAVVLIQKEDRIEEIPLSGGSKTEKELASGITFDEVAVRNIAKRNGGITFTTFTPWGYRDRTYIYLRSDEKVFSVYLPSFGDKVKLYKGRFDRGS